MKFLRVFSWIAVALSLAVFAVPGQASFRGFTTESDASPFPAEANGRDTEVPHVNAMSLTQGIKLDGHLDDEAWVNAESATGFRIWDPNRGAMPSEETVFKVAYDKDAMYFAVACLEKDPSQISAKLARRDRFSNSDLVSIYIDPYHDKTTGYNFKVNPKGVLIDAYMFNNGDRDEDWDAVWEAETYTDDEGWYTEVRIPFSSIRYRPAPSMTWGLQVYRYMHGRGEDTAWVIWDREANGFISRFGELRGINDIPPPRQLEVMPFFLQSARDYATPSTDDKVQSHQSMGADVKYGVTADLTLNATVQPDFGQVESDPAVLNLSPFETFFDEKRPFFVEGSRFFQHPDFNLFYSRRIGTGDQNSRIRFAGKLTGKTASNVTVAGMAAATDVTGRGQGHNLFKSGQEKAYYGVARIGKEFNDGNQRFNLMGTAVNRTEDREVVGDRRSRDAYTGGMDFDLFFDDRNYNIQGSVVGSEVHHRAGASDPSAQAWTQYGTGGSLDIRKVGGNLQFGTYGRWEHDQLDLNDMGFLSAPDEMNTGLWASHNYSPENKTGKFNRINTNVNFWRSWLYGAREGQDAVTGDVAWSYTEGHPQNIGANVNGWMQFSGYWEAWYGIEVAPEGVQRYETRGGPLMREPTTYGGWWGAQTDGRKDFLLWLEGNHFVDVADNASTNVSLGTRWNQSSALNHELSVDFNNRIDDTQYLETVDLTERPGGTGIGGRSYVFGAIHQQTLAVTLRSNILFNRNQSLELYAQPFISTGSFSGARELAAPDTYDLIDYREPGYRASDSDFSFTSLNVNMVWRWEYRPGSTLFLVYTHSRGAAQDRGSSADPARWNNPLDPTSVFDTEPDNLFLAKITYWLAI